jgi:hypothetical protein
MNQGTRVITWKPLKPRSQFEEHKHVVEDALDGLKNARAEEAALSSPTTSSASICEKACSPPDNPG